ncbi:MAG: hypothetical protein ACYCYP_12375 [Leptospirales bacterium]
MWIAWGVLLFASHAMQPTVVSSPHEELEPGQEGGPSYSGPHFQPVANGSPSLPGALPFNPAPSVSPFNPSGAGPLGQSPGVFQPPSPTNSLPVPLMPVPVIAPALGLPPGSFAPASPTISLGLLGGTNQAVPASPNAFVIPFSMGPTTLLNQFAQPPLVPFGQVGVPPQAYVPSLNSGGQNPFSLQCNYYFFPNCGANGGQAQNFRYTTR